MVTSRLLTAVIAALLLIIWVPLDRVTLDDIPRRATRIATSVSHAVVRETSILIKKLGFTEVPAETVVAAPASPQKPTRGRSIAPISATHQPTSDEVTVAPPGSGPGDIDDGSEPIVVASEDGGTEKIAAGEDGNGVDK